MRKAAALWCLMLIGGLSLAGTVQAGPVSRVGTVYDEDPLVAGALRTVGRPLNAGDVLTTLDLAAVVRLDNGRVLKLSPGSAARIEGDADGDVSVTVLAGRVGLVNAAGRTLTAGQRSTFTLSPGLDPDAAEERLRDVDLTHSPSREVDAERTARGAGRGR